MTTKSPIVLTIIFGLCMIITSCVKDNDLIQENELESTSKMKSNLLLVSFDASSLVDTSTKQARTFLADTTFLEFNDSSFMRNQMSVANLNFQFENSMDQDFIMEFEFLDDGNEVKYKVHIPIASGYRDKPSMVETNIAIAIPELSTFLEATKFVYKINLSKSDKTFSMDDTGKLHLQSDATYFLEL
ncbi:MAG: hypothetical protein ACSHXF_06990 [Aquaticitalea sp.]